jgi:uncharacterized protein YkwD
MLRCAFGHSGETARTISILRLLERRFKGSGGLYRTPHPIRWRTDVSENDMRILLLVAALIAATVSAATAGDIAGQVSAYRRAHGLTAVQMDGRLNALARQQAEAMAAHESVSHSAGGNFQTRVAGLRRRLAAENIAAGFITFAETLKQWEDSAGHRENLLMVGAHRIGVASVSKPSSPYRRFWAMIITD